ncbi:hypothetical protein PAHAL_8G123900 [Panicum hallii]|uniref:Uncharacterized protein n=1 Tax=Panicum hallii TaxID=206008 RepID=A0A2T8I8R2_9POAL|nr:hypothetical protein PAHAL_8G123900 [Panicum hallii]
MPVHPSPTQSGPDGYDDRANPSAAKEAGTREDPTMEPAWVTEGILPVMMNCGGVFMPGCTWRRFHRMLTLVSFHDFWALKLRRYEIRNAASKNSLLNSNRITPRTPRLLLIVPSTGRSEGLENFPMFRTLCPKGFGSPNWSSRNTIADPWSSCIMCLDEEKKPLCLLTLRYFSCRDPYR